MKYREELKKILEYYEKEVPKKREEYEKLKINPDLAEVFEWSDVGIPGTTLYQLVRQGFLKIEYKSSKHTYYKADLDKIRAALGEGPKAEKISKSQLFKRIVGYEDIKKALLLFLDSDATGFIMYGPPASGKSLFLEDLYNYYGEDRALFVSGNELSAAGLHKMLLEYEPEALIIDEVDKAKGNDLSPLLQPLEGGFVSRIKGDNIVQAKRVKMKVFMAGNSIKNLTQELLSRCKPFIFKLPPYTREQFEQICRNYVTDCNPRILNRIIDFVWNNLDGDVRAVRNLVKVVGNNEENLEFMLKLIKKYGRY